MRYKKYVAVLFVSIFLLSILPQAPAEPAERERLIDKFFTGFFRWSHESVLGPVIFNPMSTSWKAFRLFEPPFFTADPNTVDIRYLNKTEIIISSTGHQKQPIAQKEYITFDLEFPENISEDTWFYTFDPPVIYTGEEPMDIWTKLTITTRIPEDQVIPKDLSFRINVTRHTTFGNLYFPPKETRLLYGGNFILPLWFLSAITAGFGKRYSGKTETDWILLDILVKENRYHLLEITPPESIEMGPDELLSIPVKIKNLGSHADSFNFRVNTSTTTNDDLLISPPTAITLNPGEVGYTSLSVASPRDFNDPGTLHSINIEAYSIYEPDKVFANTVVVVTRGMYVSEMNGYYASLIGLLILLIAGIYLYRRNKVLNKICKKPEKPWNIPDEKKALEKLKETNKQEYNNVLKTMSEEYQSALLWYKHYRKEMLAKHYEKISLRNSVKQIMKKITNFFKIPKKIMKKKDIKKSAIKSKPEVKEIPKAKEITPAKTAEIERKAMIDSKAEQEKLRREKLLLKIKRKQEKQRQKFKQSIY